MPDSDVLALVLIALVLFLAYLTTRLRWDQSRPDDTHNPYRDVSQNDLNAVKRRVIQTDTGLAGPLAPVVRHFSEGLDRISDLTYFPPINPQLRGFEVKPAAKRFFIVRNFLVGSALVAIVFLFITTPNPLSRALYLATLMIALYSFSGVAIGLVYLVVDPVKEWNTWRKQLEAGLAKLRDKERTLTREQADLTAVGALHDAWTSDAAGVQKALKEIDTLATQRNATPRKNRWQNSHDAFARRNSSSTNSPSRSRTNKRPSAPIWGARKWGRGRTRPRPHLPLQARARRSARCNSNCER